MYCAVCVCVCVCDVQVVRVVGEEASGEFESPLVEELVTSVQTKITNWIVQIYGENVYLRYFLFLLGKNLVSSYVLRRVVLSEVCVIYVALQVLRRT